MKAKFDQRADRMNDDGRYYISIDGVDYLAEELAFLHMTGRWPRNGVEHINGNAQDNRWENLREKTIS